MALVFMHVKKVKPQTHIKRFIIIINGYNDVVVFSYTVDIVFN